MADTEIAIRMTTLKCVQRTGEPGSDEPYVVTFSASFANGLPSGIANVTEVVSSMDTGQTHTFGHAVPLWGIKNLAGTPQPLSDPTQVIILIAVMEHDGVSSVNMIRALCQASLLGAMISGLAGDRPSRVAALTSSMSSALSGAAATGGVNPDDQIGRVRDFVVHQRDLDSLEVGQRQLRTVHFLDKDAPLGIPELRAQYEVTVEITRHAAPTPPG